MANFNDLLPAAPAGGINVRWQKDGVGNISAYYSTAGAQTPWTQAINGAGFALSNAGKVSATEFITTGNIQSPAHASIGHSFNLTWDGSAFKYVAAEAGFVLRSDSAFRIMGAAAGAAGASATLTEVASFATSGVAFNVPVIIPQAGITLSGPMDGGGFWIHNLQGLYFKNDAPFLIFTNSAGTNRYRFGIDNSSFELRDYDDAGTFTGSAWSVARSTHVMTVLRLALNMAALQNQANDAGAAGAGVAVGSVYRNGSVLMVRVA